MTSFIIHFLTCNLLISGMIVLLLIVKKLWRNHLTSRTQYNLWFLPLCLMAVPFLPVRSDRILSLISRITGLDRPIFPGGSPVDTADVFGPSAAASGWMNDFTISVSNQTSSRIGTVLFGIWIIGIAVMVLFSLRSSLRLCRIKKSALPLQDRAVRNLYKRCLEEIRVTRRIPLYSTAFLTSPAITGVLKPRIYLPIHLISDHDLKSIRYMLLHELQHYRHRDNISNYLLSAASIFYWFNPFVLTAIRAMRNDREIACDADVLNMMDPDSYRDYGSTLIDFAEKLSFSPLSSGLGGTAKQMEQRILHIASYRKPSHLKRFRSIALSATVAVLFAGITPALTSYGMADAPYQWDSKRNIASLDLSEQFGSYDGCFVLYDQSADQWTLYNEDMTAARTAPNSTYKIYDALFALEEGAITPEDSRRSWNQENYPFESWNRDQTLAAAMANSVKWYFQDLDQQLGRDVIQSYLQEIGYGNQKIGRDLSSYWMESHLKISPVEQVELLNDLCQNTFGFSPENIQAVKDSLRLSSSPAGTLYGKTGTGRVDGLDISGWFVGFIETPDDTYFFATNIQSEDSATGSSAAKITLAVLSSFEIWQ